MLSRRLIAAAVALLLLAGCGSSGGGSKRAGQPDIHVYAGQVCGTVASWLQSAQQLGAEARAFAARQPAVSARKGYLIKYFEHAALTARQAASALAAEHPPGGPSAAGAAAAMASDMRLIADTFDRQSRQMAAAPDATQAGLVQAFNTSQSQAQAALARAAAAFKSDAGRIAALSTSLQQLPSCASLRSLEATAQS